MRNNLIIFYIVIGIMVSIPNYVFSQKTSKIVNESSYKPYSNYFSNSITYSVQEVSLLARTNYDLQSNGISKQIWQDINFPNLIHCVFMVDTSSNPGGENRRTKYFVSNDTGNTWVFKGDIPPSIRSGFPCITSLSDGRAVIINHSTNGGIPLRTQIFIETSLGTSVFERKDPGSNQLNDGPIWPIGISTSSILNINKVIYVAAYNIIDTTFRNSLTNINGSGTFGGYINIPNSSTNGYSISRSGSKVGYVSIKDNLTSGNSTGSVIYYESTDDGQSWNSPVTIFNANLAGDSLGCFRSVDICFLGSVPKVLFMLCKRNGTSIYQNKPSKLMFWSPNVNSGIPVLIDSAGGMQGSNPSNVSFLSVCRGVLGSSADGNVLFCSWCRARNEVNNNGDCYFDVWFSYSLNGGAVWLDKTRITNNSPPILDYRFPSVSPFNKENDEYTAQLIFVRDSIPGLYVYGAELSKARLMYSKIKITGLVGVKSVNNIPGKFTLSQNYPNPFNPTTKIRFALPPSPQGEGLGVRVIVYDNLGKEISTLVNEQLQPGTYEVEFDGINFSSGVYYYRLIAIDPSTLLRVSETKKMLMVK